MAKKPPPAADAGGPSDLGTLADLLRQRGLAVATPSAAPAAPPPGGAVAAAGADALDLAGAGRLVVRRERKGHGGKTVTVVDGLTLPAATLETLARALRKALGCGSWVDGARIVLQGDRPDAAVAWLTRRGATRVTRGN